MKKNNTGISGGFILLLAVAAFMIGFMPLDAAAKTSSPITVTYTAPEKCEVGKDVSISIVIKAPAETMRLLLKVSPEEGLLLKTPAGGVVKYGDQPDGASLTETVTVTASKEGRLFLNVFASGVVNGKKSTSAFSIPLDIGDAKKPVTKQGKEVKDSAGRGLTVMPAEEPKKAP